MAGEKTELHQPPGIVFRQIQTVQDSRFPMFQFHEVGGLRVVLCVPNLFDIRLHVEPSIHLDWCKVKLLEQAHNDIHLQLAYKSYVPSSPFSGYTISD